ncbi:MAG: RadC family protein [Saccharofermentanales bacterium]|nr:DNA repair protein RadC [Clostridiaceae bacterium]
MLGKQQRITMRSMPLADRPYEKLLALGAKNLTDAELLAVIIRSGTRRETALALSQRLIGNKENGMENGIRKIRDYSPEELMVYPGIGPVKAAQILAAMEIGARANSDRRRVRQTQIRSPDDAICLLETDMLALPREELRIVLLDVRNRVIRISRVSEGGLSSAVIHPRELFREAIRANAAAMILAHNHPSGDASPSAEDLETTRRLIEAGQMMGIQVIDHIILASGGSLSLKRTGLI